MFWGGSVAQTTEIETGSHLSPQIERGRKVCSFRLSFAVLCALNHRGSWHTINFTVPVKELLNPTRAAEINLIIKFIIKSMSNR
jgi:hypothetical protein